jgi:XisI protein
MDKIKKYSSIVLSTLNDYKNSNGSIETYVIADEKQHHFQVTESGWLDKDDYYFNVKIHIQIKEKGKIWLLENKTEDDLAQILIENGVLKSDIVLSFIPERVRKLSGYAVS